MMRTQLQSENGVHDNYLQHQEDQRNPQFDLSTFRVGRPPPPRWPSELVGTGSSRGATRPRAARINSPVRMHAPQTAGTPRHRRSTPAAELTARWLAALNSWARARRDDIAVWRPREAGERLLLGAGSVDTEPARRRDWRDARRRDRRLAALGATAVPRGWALCLRARRSIRRRGPCARHPGRRAHV